MKMSQEEFQALSIAKEITIAKLSASSPNHTNENVGVEIGEMFTAIYKATLKIVTKEVSE